MGLIFKSKSRLDKVCLLVLPVTSLYDVNVLKASFPCFPVNPITAVKLIENSFFIILLEMSDVSLPPTVPRWDFCVQKKE